MPSYLTIVSGAGSVVGHYTSRRNHIKSMKLLPLVFSSKGREKGLKIKKGGKGGGIYLLMFGAFGAMMLQLFMTKIALIAGKALLVGKVALLLAGVIGLKSLLSHGHEEKHASQIIYAEPEVHHGSGGWSRSTHIPEAAHDLAYRGQRSLQH
ncbi:hypothetical protein J6590_087817 [Homalodisca vitripennis]|nr:hypothetical protein J6590_087817 [Homalodisca vitripennis]